MNEHDARENREKAPGHREIVRNERFELLYHVTAVLEPVMVMLGILFLVLLLMDFGSVPLVLFGENRSGQLQQGIWAIFLVDFLLRLVIAPEKWAFLRANWLGAVSLALPFLRPLRVFRAARAVRGFSLVRLLGGLNRGMRVLRRITRGRQLAFIAGLTVVVVLGGAVAVWNFDRGYDGATIQTFPDALWWSATLVTTMNGELYVVSTEARIVALLQRLYALSVFGYITASFASFLIGTNHERTGPSPEDIAGLRREVQALRRELRAERGE